MKEGKKSEGEGKRKDEGVGVGGGGSGEGKGHMVGHELLLEHRGCYQNLNVIR